MSAGHAAPRDHASAVWLRRLAPAPQPWVRLVCFPHAGGTAAFFRSWHDVLPADIELYAVQYPGRLDRVTDPCVRDMDLVAGPVAAAIRSLSDRPLALFGHSLGAVIAYEVTRRLPARPRPAVARLFVSGRPAPDRQRSGTKHLASDEALWAELARLGGTAPDVLADGEIRRAFLPALRSDYCLSETYRPRPGPPLECPVTVLLGDRDPEVDLAEAASWANFTRAELSVRTFPGEHFYLTACLPEVVREIHNQLTESLPARSPDWAGP